MELLRETDIENLRKNKSDKAIVKLFNPYGAGTWWLHNYCDEEEEIVWGWAMINCDTPEYGTIPLKQIRELKMFGVSPIERDMYFEPCNINDMEY